MKLNNILKENTGSGLTFRDLTSMHISVLVRLAKGQLSPETATPREQVTLDELANYNLVDDFGELTPTGEKAAELGAKHGSYERGEASLRTKALNRQGGNSTEIPTDDDYVDDDDDDDEVDNMNSGTYR